MNALQRELLLEAEVEASRAQQIDWATEGAGAIVTQLEALRLTLAATIAEPADETREAFEQWADVELMGHRRRIGCVREIEVGHRTFLEVSALADPDLCAACKLRHRDQGEYGGCDFVEPAEFTVEVYSPSAVFCMTPLTEELARKLAERDREVVGF